jgi:hypothetical protein
MAEGVDIIEFGQRKPELEDVFLSFVEGKDDAS